MMEYRTREGNLKEIPRLDKNKKYVLDENLSVHLAKTDNIIPVRDFYKSLGFKALTSVPDTVLLDNATKNGLTIITNDKGLCWLATHSGIEIIFYERVTKRLFLNTKEQNNTGVKQ